MGTSDFVPLNELVAQIARMCGQGLTGTVLLVSDDNRMAQVHLHAGKIVFVMCRGRRGRDALGLMRTMRSARLSVDGMAVVTADGSGMQTDAILAYLDGSLEQLPDAPAPTGPRRLAGTAAAAAAPADFLTPRVRLACQQTLARYIGPMAEIVCGEHFASVADARALALALAAELPAREQAAKFKAEIAKVLAIDHL